MITWQYCTLEWIWDAQSIRLTQPNKPEKTYKGSYQEVVDTLTALGSEGWEVINCVTGSNWLFWTLKKSNFNLPDDL